MVNKTKARICVPICVSRVSDITPASSRAEDFADLVEIRLDCLSESEFAGIKRELHELHLRNRCPIIFTLRPADQCGLRALDIATRFGFWVSEGAELLRDNQNFADVEVDVAIALASAEPFMSTPDWDRIICSYHDAVSIPDDLEEIYRRMIGTRARALKVAVQIDNITDCIPVLRLLERSRLNGREMIAIAMGDAGILTRILGPSRGAFLTYGWLDETRATAPGQISASELRDVYRIHTINEETRITGLVGENVMHSVSPQMHNAAYAASGLNSVYIPFEVRDLDDFVQRMVHPRTRELDWNLRGLSITAPHKSEIMKYLEWIDPIALEIGAVNTVVISKDGLRGYNTDASAVLVPLFGLIDLNGASVAVIGAGGAARALLWSLLNAGARVNVFARDVELGNLTTEQFGVDCTTLAGASFSDFDVVVNTTPLGMRGPNEDLTPVVAKQLRGAKLAYDLVYNPIETRFISEAREAGCECIGGLPMLVAQAVDQFKLWTGKDASLDIMRDAASKALRSNEV